MLLDMYTYGTFCMLAADEWDWRAFMRHIYTILYEHPITVNRQLNDIIKILKEELDEDFPISGLVHAKKNFSTFIIENSSFAKQIRVNVDAHFDGDFEERLSLIENLSYSSFIELYYAYTSKMHDFLTELRPALVELRRSADVSFYSMFIRR